MDKLVRRESHRLWGKQMLRLPHMCHPRPLENKLPRRDPSNFPGAFCKPEGAIWLCYNPAKIAVSCGESKLGYVSVGQDVPDLVDVGLAKPEGAVGRYRNALGATPRGGNGNLGDSSVGRDPSDLIALALAKPHDAT